MKKNWLFAIAIATTATFMSSCEHKDECHECHIAWENAAGQEVEVEIGEFCGPDLEEVETDGYSHTIVETIIGNDTVPAGSYSEIHCEEHADH